MKKMKSVKNAKLENSVVATNLKKYPQR